MKHLPFALAPLALAMTATALADDAPVLNTVNVTADGFNQTVLFHNGDPALIDVGHQLGLGNRLNRIP